MDQPLKIRAEVLPHDPASCKFTIERPVYPGGWARFVSGDQATGSPLAEKLFSVEGVTGVIIHEDEVIVSAVPSVAWRAVGPLIGSAIREWAGSGAKPVSEDAVKNASSEDQLRVRIQKVLDDRINPEIAAHNGLISLLDVRGNDVFIKMGGGCQGCASADVTLRGGVETMLRDLVPEIGRILDTTDHAAGTNPYYSAH